MPDLWEIVVDGYSIRKRSGQANVDKTWRQSTGSPGKHPFSARRPPVIMIIGPKRLRQALGASARPPHEISPTKHRWRHATLLRADDIYLVFAAGTNQPKGGCARPSSTRMEEIAADKIELSNGTYMVQYREQLMPWLQMRGPPVTVRTQGAPADSGVRRDRRADGDLGRRDHRHRRGTAPNIEVARLQGRESSAQP